MAAQVPSLKEFLTAPILHEDRIDVPTDTAEVQTRLVRQPKTGMYTLVCVFFHYGIPDPVDVRSVDMLTGEVKSFLIPNIGHQIHMSLGRGVIATNGNLYFFTKPTSMFALPTPIGDIYCFNPTENTLQSVATPPGGSYTRLSVDGDYVYGNNTQQRRVCLYRYDTKKNTFREYGPISPVFDRGGETHGYSTIIYEGYAYIACGKIPWRLMAVNLKTGKSNLILEAPTGPGQLRCGINQSGHAYAMRRPDPKDVKKQELFELKDGEATPVKPSRGMYDFGEKKEAKDKAVAADYKPEIWKGQLTPDQDGNCQLWYRRTGPKGKGRWRRVRMKVNTFPQSVRRLSALPDGRLFGTPGSHNSNFIYDPATGKSVRPGGPCRFSLSHYATVMHKGKIYMSGYPNSPLYVYDPAKPWTLGQVSFGRRSLAVDDPKSNPRLIRRLHKSGAHKMWDGAVGSDGKLYFCGIKVRDGSGGALGWWDPETGEEGAEDDELFNGYATYYMYKAEGGKKLVLNSHVTRNSVTRKTPESARVFVFDVERKEVVDSCEPIPGAKMLGPVVEYAPGKVISMADVSGYRVEGRKDILWGLDIRTKKVLFQIEMPLRFCGYNRGIRGGQEWQLGPDKHVWGFASDDNNPEYPTLIRIDPQTQDVKIVGRINRRGPLAFSGNDLYIGSEHKAGHLMIRRLTDIVPAP